MAANTHKHRTSSALRIAFFAYAYNLAEVTRAVEVGRACRARGAEVRFFTHGGTHESRIAEAGFPLTTLEPLVAPEKNRYLMDLDQGRALGQPFSFSEWCAGLYQPVTNPLDYRKRTHPVLSAQMWMLQERSSGVNHYSAGKPGWRTSPEPGRISFSPS